MAKANELTIDTAKEAKKALRNLASPEKAEVVARFFKTGKGQYGEGDLFIGVTVPETRRVAKSFHSLPLSEITLLLKSKVHEDRLLALIILVNRMKNSEPPSKAIYDFYLEHMPYINNWDLVDTSAAYIVGRYLESRDRKILYRWAKSNDLWTRRIAIISTFHFIKNKDTAETFKLAIVLLNDSHDLIHKAVGWMLREAGKYDLPGLKAFLDENAARMPRTMLRYAIEKLTPKERKHYMVRESKRDL